MKLFKKKTKEVIEDPIVYLNKRKDHKFLFFTRWGDRPLSNNTRKIIRKVSLIVLPVLAIGLGTTLGIIANNNANNDQVVNNVVIDNNISKRRVYLISDDNLTVPLTVTLDKKNSVYEEMLDVINLLRITSKASNEYIHGFINEESKVNSFTLNDDGDLKIDFSTDFFVNDNYNENKKIEAIVATMLQFDKVNSLSLSIDG